MARGQFSNHGPWLLVWQEVIFRHHDQGEPCTQGAQDDNSFPPPILKKPSQNLLSTILILDTWLAESTSHISISSLGFFFFFYSWMELFCLFVSLPLWGYQGTWVPLFLVFRLNVLSRGSLRLPCWLSGKESACQCRRCQFDLWVRKIPWRKKWQPPPVFLPGKPHGQRSLAGYSPWGCKRVRHDLAAKQQQKSSLSSRKELGIVQTNHKCSSSLCQWLV